MKNWRWILERYKSLWNDLHLIISLRYSSSLISATFIDALSRTFRRLFISWFNLLKRRSYLNEMRSVRWHSIIWRDIWLRLWYFVTLIKFARSFSKSIHSTTLMMKFCLNMMTRKYYIQWSFIVRTCLLLMSETELD